MSLFSMGQQLGQMAANKGLQMAKKPSGGVRRRNETRDQFRGRMDNNNSDIDAIFRGIQQTRTKVHKGLSGMPLNPDGTDPGNSFDRFMRQNPHLGGAAQRQAQYDQQARVNAYQQAAQNSLMRAQEQQPTSKSVVGADGYRSIFDQQGNMVGTTAPVGEKGSRVFDDALGEMVPMDAWSQQKNYVQGTKGMNATAMQQAARKSITSKPSGIDQIFGGGTKQPSPSGVAGGGVVEPTQPKGAPGGELFGQMPEFKSNGMTMPKRGSIYPPNAGPQYTPMMPNDVPQFPTMNPNEGPQLPQFSQDQQEALRNLFQGSYGLQQSGQLASNPRIAFTDIFPGNDYQAVNDMFPTAGNSAWDRIENLRKMLQNPAVYDMIFNR